MVQRRITTSHSDENPELNPNNQEGEPIAAYSTEGSAVSDLYKKDRDPFHYQPKAGETVVYEEIYIPPEE